MPELNSSENSPRKLTPLSQKGVNATQNSMLSPEIESQLGPMADPNNFSAHDLFSSLTYGDTSPGSGTHKFKPMFYQKSFSEPRTQRVFTPNTIIRAAHTHQIRAELFLYPRLREPWQRKHKFAAVTLALFRRHELAQNAR